MCNAPPSAAQRISRGEGVGLCVASLLNESGPPRAASSMCPPVLKACKVLMLMLYIIRGKLY